MECRRRRIKQWRTAEIIGRHVSAFYLPQDVAAGKPQQALDVAARQGGFEEEGRRLRKDGSVFWADVTITPVRDEQGQMRGFAKVVCDVTDRKRMEQSLVLAKAAAEAANQAKSRFLANISHEFRTPMNAILGMVDLTLQKTTDPAARDYLQTAKESAGILLALLNDLLDSAKIESGKLELESAPFSLRRLLDNTAQVLGIRAAEKGISFSVRIPDDAPDAFVGDHVRLEQILFNLAGNAIKFTERGEVEISVKMVEGLGIGDWGLAGAPRPPPSDSPPLTPNPQSLIPVVTLAFAVRDTGIGIPRSELEHIFQPFAQADPSTTRRFGGTGLGLTICSNLIALMGGRIWVESEPGHGSTFYFTVRLPLAKEPPAKAEPVIDAAPASPLRILLVEDNPANQKVAAYLLRERGHTVEIAADGRQALQFTQHNRYDVILMDLQMPGMNGLEATAAIRAPRERGRHVPIVAMTAHAMKEDRERCLAMGMDGYLSKPINAPEVISLVEGLAARSAAAGPPAPTGPTTDCQKRGTGTAPDGPSAAKQPCGEAPVPPGSRPCSSRPAVVFDYELALKRCLNKRDLLARMIQFFFEEVDDLLPQMRAALQKDDLQEVGRLGHRLKGTIIHLGAEGAWQAALPLERLELHGGQRHEAEEALNALERECHALKSALIPHRTVTCAPPGRDSKIAS